MNFEEFLSQARGEHATNTEDVARRLVGSGSLIEKNDQIPQLAQFVTHVFGEHLGRWSEGVDVLEKLKDLPHFIPGSESESAIARSVATLQLASGEGRAIDYFSISEQVRILAIAAAALAGRSETDQARSWFEQALQKAQSGITKEDPANRALAVTSNNLAQSLEEKTHRTVSESALMIFSAQTARHYWEIAGTWLEVERAEYRLAMSFLQSGDISQARRHASLCLDICKNNQAFTLEVFFGLEALTRLEKVAGDRNAFERATALLKSEWEKLTAENKKWTQPILAHAIA